MRALVSDETLLGWSIFFSMAAAALLVLMGLGVFAYSEGGVRDLEVAQGPAPTIVSLTAEASVLVNTNPVPKRELPVVFGEMRLSAPIPPLVVRCGPNVRHGELMDVLGKARAAGLKDVRLIIAREGGGE